MAGLQGSHRNKNRDLLMTIDRRRFLELAGTGTGVLVAGASDEVAAQPSRPAPQPGANASPAISKQLPDVVVVGAGAFGVWTSYYLQRMGARVRLVDAYGPGNSRSTSGGETRGVRSSYGENLQWIRWAREALTRWKAFDEEVARPMKVRLFYETGDVILRNDWDGWLRETVDNWKTLGHPHEVLTGDEMRRRWPAISTNDRNLVVYDQNAGVVRARRACEVVAEAFRQAGGEVTIARAAVGSRSGDSLLDIELGAGQRLAAGKFVFAVGPWLPYLFPDVLGNRVRAPMGNVFFFGTPPGDNRFTHPNMPSWNVPGVTGWPALGPDNRGFRVRTGGGASGNPDESVRWIPEESHQRARQILVDYFPDMRDMPLLETRSCHYVFSTNRNFIIDRFPGYSNVWVAGAGQAEGFKFGPVTGEYTAKRVTGEQNDPEFDAQFAFPTEEYETEGGDEPAQ
jgi:glycine/D-amino acid oxidase-like deaminating enzyme